MQQRDIKVSTMFMLAYGMSILRKSGTNRRIYPSEPRLFENYTSEAIRGFDVRY
jgi:hypothetical protein